MTLLISIIVIVVLLVIVAVVLPKLKAAGAGEPDVEEGAAAADVGLYVRRPYLLTAAEYSYYKVLHQVLPADRIVLVKVRLADLFDVKGGLERGPRQTALNRITRKHLDFVICDRATCVPVLAIELDDASHGRPDRQTRDLFVDGLCRAAGLPLVRQPARRGYTLEEARAALGAGSSGLPPAVAGA